MNVTMRTQALDTAKPVEASVEGSEPATAAAKTSKSSAELTGDAKDPGSQVVHPVIVVGGGPSGIRVAQELARQGRDAIVFNAERWDPYNRVKLTPLLSGDVQLGQVQQALNFKGDGKVSVYSDHSVIDIDREAKTVTTKYGRVWPYDKLIICTGSRAHVPPIPGIELPGIFTFRNFDDVEKLVARSFSSRRCAIIGGGLLGLEAARGMADRGVKTWVIEHEPHLMARQLDSRAGEFLKNSVEKMGLHVLVGSTVSAFAGNERVERIELANGEVVECDTVIICTGIRANMELARDVGLSVGRGIKVSETLQTNDPDIYAVGECAEFEGNIYGLVGPGFEQATVAVRHLVGETVSYAGSVPATKLKIIGTDVFSMGSVDQLDQRIDVLTLACEDKENGIYRRLVLEKGRLIGAIAIGDWPEFNRVQEAIKTKAFVMPWQRQRFRRLGLVWPKTEPKSVKDWPRAATVCNCTGVTRGQIGDCISLGASSLEDVKRDTGASTVCGSCKVHINTLLDAPSAIVREPTKAWQPLAILSVIAACLAIVALVSPVWPMAKRIDFRGIAEMLFLDSYVKQVTGYTLLAISTLAAILSLRKRISWLRKLGDFSGWRIFHFTIGILGIVALLAHTGFRLGANLNMWLMLTFIGVIVAGGLAGLVTAIEHRLFNTPNPAARARTLSFWFHLIAFWPLPLLLAVHILTVYYY